MFKGSNTALITPFRNGAVDEKALADIVDWQIREGTHGLVPVGTTGESPTLDNDEHKKVIEITIEVAAGRVPVIAGTGSNSTAEAIELSQHAEQAGANGLLIVTPYYNKPNRAGVRAHFEACAGATELPVIVYNIPSRCVVNIPPDDLAALATFSLVRDAVDAAEALGVRYHVGNIFSADLFYTPDTAMFETLAKYNVLGVEMEAAGIFPIAAEHGAESLAICTVSDDIRTGEALTADERATTFDEMIKVALETARKRPS